MKLRLIQNSRGSYNWLDPSHKTTSFKLAIVDDNGGIVKHNGNDCILYYGGEDYYPEDFDHVDDLDSVFEQCWEYAGRVFGTTDYRGQCIAFATVLWDNYKEINHTLQEERKAKLTAKIEALQKELEKNVSIDDLYYQARHEYHKVIWKYEDWLSKEEEKLEQVKPGSELHKKAKANIDKYQSVIDKYQNLYDKYDSDIARTLNQGRLRGQSHWDGIISKALRLIRCY